MVAVSVFPEDVLLVEGNGPLGNGELIRLVDLQERDALPADQNGALLLEEGHAVVARDRLEDREHPNSVGLARLQLVRRFREVRTGQGIVEVVGGLQLLGLLGEGVELGVIHVVGRHRELEVLHRRTEALVHHGEFLQDGLHLLLQRAARLDDFLSLIFREAQRTNRVSYEIGDAIFLV
ncbi:hypothetical protein A3B84_02445 [Candidatus Nomurabacteria bacterium RIFCSPHIGHO2_02_FULL_35_13]|uniref:Uncharacterized protein n=1 Tax=Candidatus Nomurabacteria bacterium RIFCSPHIGHO2_02_FULL_35_13 TaxID=1801748 RepID=A0A1F6VPJ5_9BACT|nr:MAG: hypothetical protein A3B84_02445 [Candidatus Nomurabacteria bacterium RIFCSPHIGHO2_02_FULL_35_13]